MLDYTRYISQGRIYLWVVCFVSGIGGHGYGGQSDSGAGFHSGHFVHMRGLPFRATEGDIAKVRKHTQASYFYYLTLGKHQLWFLL